jgi:hypothetical protein
VSNWPEDVIWLTTQEKAPAFFKRLPLDAAYEESLIRITLELSPSSRRLHRFEPWAKKHDPAMHAGLVSGEITEDGWREHWVYKGVITPDKIVAIDFYAEVNDDGERHVPMMEWKRERGEKQ